MSDHRTLTPRKNALLKLIGTAALATLGLGCSGTSTQAPDLPPLYYEETSSAEPATEPSAAPQASHAQAAAPQAMKPASPATAGSTDEIRQIVTRLNALDRQLRQQRQDQQHFQEMVSTNMELIEQSVAVAMTDRSESAAGMTPSRHDSFASPSSTAGMMPGATSPGMTAAGMTTAGMTTAGMMPSNASQHAQPNAPHGNAAYRSVSVAAPETGAGEDRDLSPPLSPIILHNEPGAKQAYERGYARFVQGDDEGSLRIFEDFLASYRHDRHRDNAQFWIGEAYLHKNDLQAAEQAYRQVLRHYEHRPTREGFKTPDAIYRLGQIYQLRGQPERAAYYFSHLVAQFPQSPSARKAQRALGSLVDTASTASATH